jgi:hypothetical protein
MNVTPQQLAKMDSKQATNLIIAMVSKFEREGKWGSTIEAYAKALKNWLAWNDIAITKRIKISGASESVYESEVVPTQQELIAL